MTLRNSLRAVAAEGMDVVREKIRQQEDSEDPAKQKKKTSARKRAPRPRRPRRGSVKLWVFVERAPESFAYVR